MENGQRPNLPRSNPFHPFPYDKVCVYAGYKEMLQLFGVGSPVFEIVDWQCVGLPGRDGSKSVFWMGTKGAYTPCHYDTYGYNVVTQLYGRKRWTLYPPSDERYLYPTRIPYEESSVFSAVDHKQPDSTKYPLFAGATKYEVVLEPGDVLFVPNHWWHLVESLETSISVNTWVEQ
ncbi:HSPB1-associated protein 1-like, partial [Sycon ciliatum]|uniref:HSPB1-associated protein 1-like n=1 Tax=Sycon ciliatum TaxID=27933 RepID=UPI0031F72046